MRRILNLGYKLASNAANSNDIDNNVEEIEQELLAEAMDAARTQDHLYQKELNSEGSDRKIDLTVYDGWSDDEVHLNLNDLHDKEFL